MLTRERCAFRLWNSSRLPLSNRQMRDFAAFLFVLVAVACSETAKQPTVPNMRVTRAPVNSGGGIGGTVSVESSGIGACIGDDAIASGFIPGMKDASDLNCTSTDVSVAGLVQAYSLDSPAGPFIVLGPADRISCFDGQLIWAVTAAALQQKGGSPRTDIGLWVAASEGGNAITGSCRQYTLASQAAGVFDLDGDQCGDLISGSTTIVALELLPLACHDDGTGFVHIAACVGWSQPGADRICPTTPPGGNLGFRFGSVPGGKSKCGCGAFDVPVDVVP